MPKTILVADDNQEIRKALCEMFEMEEDYDLCAEAINGAEAVRLARELKGHLRGIDSPIDRVVSKNDSEDLINHVRSLAPV
jgi:DNA-binding NarL/FixJ family response regulator